MQLVIDIPEKAYNRIRSRYGRFGAIKNGIWSEDLTTVSEAICDGTVLPKGHGALKDATTLMKMFEDKVGDVFTAFHFFEAVDDCPTIIEAYKEVADADSN